jgi:hypothetical protein
MMHIAAHHYAYAASRFLYILGRIDQSLTGAFCINDNFAWETLRQLGEVLYRLETCLFGPLPRHFLSDLECLFMVTGRSRRGRPASARTRHLQLADSHESNVSWGKLTLHAPNCDRKGGCDCRETTRKESRRLIRYLQDLLLTSKDFEDLAYLEECLAGPEQNWRPGRVHARTVEVCAWVAL